MVNILFFEVLDCFNMFIILSGLGFDNVFGIFIEWSINDGNFIGFFNGLEMIIDVFGIYILIFINI